MKESHDAQSDFIVDFPPKLDLNFCEINRTFCNQSTVDLDFQMPSWSYIFMTAIYVCIFIIGLVGNFLVILVIAKDQRMRNTANFYLISLSVADFMIIAFCLPVSVYELHTEEVWNLGPLLCRLAPLLQYLSTNASISTMVAISIERFIVICRPFKVRTLCTKKRASGVIFALWAFSFASSFPILLFTKHLKDYHPKLKREVHFCYIDHSSHEVYFYFHLALFYILPGLLLSLLYSLIICTLRKFKCEQFGHSPDSRKNTVRGGKSQSDTSHQLIIMLSTVVLCYFICLLPYNTIIFLSLISDRILINLGPVGYNILLVVSRIMFFANSCSNPILYNAISGKFRSAFMRLFCPKRYQTNGRDSRTHSMRSMDYDPDGRRLSEYRSTGGTSGQRRCTKRTLSSGEAVREICSVQKSPRRSADRSQRRLTEPFTRTLYSYEADKRDISDNSMMMAATSVIERPIM